MPPSDRQLTYAKGSLLGAFATSALTISALTKCQIIPDTPVTLSQPPELLPLEAGLATAVYVVLYLRARRTSRNIASQASPS